MAQSLSNLLVHIVFSTKNRHPYIQPEIEPRVYNYIAAICDSLNSPAIYIGGMPDHVHILLKLSPTVTLSDLISKIKSNSSRFIKGLNPQCSKFAWQRGYGGFTLGQSSKKAAIKYIANQKIHHKKMSFQEELLKLLNKYDIEYDEKYLWD